MNSLIKMNNVRLSVSFFATSIIFKFLQAPEKGVKLDSKTADILKEMIFDFSKLPQNIFADCAASRHGLKQKMVDSLAMNADTKAVTSIQDAAAILEGLWKNLSDGNWNAPSRAAKGETVKLSALEEQFLSGVKLGTVPFEQAAALYLQITGKVLPALPVVEENEDGSEIITEEQLDENV